MFMQGDKIVHPMHGAGIIQDIIKKQVDGQEVDYYCIELVSSNIAIFVPVSFGETGLRSVHTKEELLDIIHKVKDCDVQEESNWNKRYRENMLKIRSGDFSSVIAVVQVLENRQNGHALSNGEKKMYTSAKHILASEIATAFGISYDDGQKYLTDILH